MEERFVSAGKEVLVELVKLAQKRGMEGSKGSWKQFLSVHDKKFGSSLSDPRKRSIDALVAFLNTFSREDDLKFFDKVMQSHSNRAAVKQFIEKSADVESPEQKLVRLTVAHPQYLLDYLFPSHEEGWLVTKCSKKKKVMKSNAMIAVDCEMVLCEDGTEALVKVCAVDRNLQVKLNELVKPNKAIVDYRSEITGVTAADLEGVTYSLADVQKSMKKLLSHGTILVGHSLNNDLQALKLDHARVIDTSLIFKYGDETNFRRPSLNNLCKVVLGYEVRKKGAVHNCLDDAYAAMKLVLCKVESGYDEAIPLVHEVPEIEMSKLLIHRIPINVASEELRNIIPGDFDIEIKTNKKGRGDKYSAFAIFKGPQEANQAFESVIGNQEEDSSGLLQKCVLFQLDSGIAGSLLIRKMVHDNIGKDSRKRMSKVETICKSKKLKLNPEDGEQSNAGPNCCDGHLKEIERLKQELKQRDEEISNLNKILVALTRKQGL
ncbi:Exoribonuclease II [Bertholletia excelsa]